MPVLNPKLKSKVEVDEDHGLWGFFNKERRLLATPEEDLAHGRAWTVQELRQKSWDDLHSLWWICVKERNRIATEKRERQRIQAGYGDFEADDRDQTVGHIILWKGNGTEQTKLEHRPSFGLCEAVSDTKSFAVEHLRFSNYLRDRVAQGQ